MRPSLPPRLALPTVLTIGALAAVAAVIALDLGTVPALAALGVALLTSLWTLVSVRQMVLAPMVDLATHFTGADGGEDGEPVDVQHLRERGDAIGAIATALLDHQARVEQLTAEQAVLADGLATTMTDVARRGLALVNRMLDRLAAMQHEESDAERLQALYALDHLAVRLRGQSENLLVVADTAPTGDPDEAPMRMVDLVRLAGSQTEDYTRVTVESAASVAVVGWASRPLAQLVTALLDNALRYSPPDQPVVVTSHQVPEGVIVSIRDRGIGMDDDALQAAVQTIQAPPLLQAAQSRQLGLYVTGLLSRRLGTWVQLARAQDADGGILATVGVPSALLAVAPAMLLTEQHAPVAVVHEDPVETTRAAEARRLAAAAELLLPDEDLAGPPPAVAPPAQPAGDLPTRPGDPVGGPAAGGAAAPPARPTYPTRPLPTDLPTDLPAELPPVQPAAAAMPVFPAAAPVPADAPASALDLPAAAYDSGVFDAAALFDAAPASALDVDLPAALPPADPQPGTTQPEGRQPEDREPDVTPVDAAPPAASPPGAANGFPVSSPYVSSPHVNGTHVDGAHVNGAGPAEIVLPDAEAERGERRRRKQKAASSWSMSFPGAASRTEEEAAATAGGLASFVNDKLTPRRRQAAEAATPRATAADQLSSRPMFVEVPVYTPPSLSEPADYIPDLVDNPLLDVLPEHPTAHLNPVLPTTTELRAGGVDMPTVLDGIRMAGSPSEEPTAPVALPTRAPRSIADDIPVARLFADLVGDAGDDDPSQFSALAGLVAADPEGTS